jgi:hypothetical protein
MAIVVGLHGQRPMASPGHGDPRPGRGSLTMVNDGQTVGLRPWRPMAMESGYGEFLFFIFFLFFFFM